MFTNLTLPPFCGSVILNKKEATVFFYISTCSSNPRFLSIAVTILVVDKQLNQTVIIDHLKYNCGQSQTACYFTPCLNLMGHQPLTPSDGGLQPIGNYPCTDAFETWPSSIAMYYPCPHQIWLRYLQYFWKQKFFKIWHLTWCRLRKSKYETLYFNKAWGQQKHWNSP